jgi:hypothetical protein
MTAERSCSIRHSISQAPDRATRAIRWLRTPDSRRKRLALGVLFILGSFFWFLPVVGIEWLPIGRLLIAEDVPILCRPAAGLRNNRQTKSTTTIEHGRFDLHSRNSILEPQIRKTRRHSEPAVALTPSKDDSASRRGRHERPLSFPMPTRGVRPSPLTVLLAICVWT